MNKTRGKFITVEGQDGAGKTTNIGYIHRLLERHNVEVILTREPGGTKLGEDLRHLVLEGHDHRIDATTELLLIFAARAQHLAEIIRPTLDRGTWVLCDRFTDATYAYQGGGRGVPREHIHTLQTLVQDGLQPDLTLLLDVDIDTGLARSQQRGPDRPDRFEQEKVVFKQRVRSEYLRLAEQHPDRIQIVDASTEIAQVQCQIDRIILAFMEEHVAPAVE